MTELLTVTASLIGAGYVGRAVLVWVATRGAAPSERPAILRALRRR